MTKPEKSTMVKSKKVKKSSKKVSLQKPETPVKEMKKKRLLDDSSDEEEYVSKKPAISAKKGFTDLIVKEADSSSSEEDEDVTQGEVKKRKKLTKRQKELKNLKEEELLREAERSRLKKKDGPETEQEYRELLQSDRTCSATWIKYICHLLSIGEVERAHGVAREGLTKIPSENQNERINLWTVLLRIEVKYASGKLNAEKTLIEACGNCDDYILFTNMAGIYEDEGVYDKAEAMYLKLTKKFFAELDVWIKAGAFYYKNRRLTEARALLNKAYIVLKKKLVPEVTTRFAKMEYEFGEKDKACSMYESLLSNYPKRLDIWNVYVDLLIKDKDIERARQIFNRMTSLVVNTHKKCKIFEKFVSFEDTHGTPQTRNLALNAATEFYAMEDKKLEQNI